MMLKACAILVATAALSLSLMTFGCSGCEDEVVQRQDVGESEITVIRRVCGSVSGYQVSVKPRGLDTTGIADRYEPFAMTCDCYASPSANSVPVSFTVRGSVVVVRYDQSKAWGISKQRDRQGPFSVRYEPFGSEPQRERGGT
jgi:hypothetical protein